MNPMNNAYLGIKGALPLNSPSVPQGWHLMYKHANAKQNKARLSVPNLGIKGVESFEQMHCTAGEAYHV